MERLASPIELAKIAGDAMGEVPSMLAELEGRTLEENAPQGLHWPTRFLSVGIKHATGRWTTRFVASGFKKASQRLEKAVGEV